ncbi:MAG: lytic transglycosylase domain-containing protein [Pseudomonadota bacterium]
MTTGAGTRTSAKFEGHASSSGALTSVLRDAESLPLSPKVFFAAHAAFAVGLMVLASVLGTMAPRSDVVRESLALRPQPLTQPWVTELHGFAERVHRGFGIRRDTALEFSEWILEAAERQGFRPELLASLVLTESSFRKQVRSGVGAVGPAQVRPSFWRRFCGTRDLTDPAENIYCGAQVLALYRDRCGDTICALEAYNVGPKSRRQRAAARYVAKIDYRLSQLGHELAPEDAEAAVSALDVL